jgi:ComF family protein
VQYRSPFLTCLPLDEQGRCALYRRGVRGFDVAYSFGFYGDELRQLIHLFKYTGVRTLAASLGRQLAQAMPREDSFDVIVRMPLHWRKRWQRGFNQSEWLAREIGRRTHTPVRNALRRVQHTAPQAGLTSVKRRLNVSGAFLAKKNPALADQRVLLVDDVMTTGATAASCARALKMAGAQHVTLARADRCPMFDPLLRDSKFSGSSEDAQS